MTKILIIQPSFAHYRYSLFNLLHDRYNVLFAFIRSTSTYPSGQGPNPDWNMISLRKESNIFWFFEFAIQIFKFKPDVIITSINESLQTVISIIIGHATQVPVILWSLNWSSPHLIKHHSYINRAIKESIIKWTTKRSDALVVSGTRSKRYNQSLSSTKTPIFIAFQSTGDQSLMVDESIAESITQKKKDFINILYFSRVVELKGLDTLIHAFAGIEKNYKSSQLLVVGDGPFRSHCEALAKKLNVTNIKFYGAIQNEHAWKYYRQSDIFVLPNSGDKSVEAWGLVINEAASMGLPIVTTNFSGSVGDLVLDGVNGYVVEAGNVSEMQDAIEKLLIDSSNREKMGIESRSLFELINNYDKMYEGFNNAICHVLEMNKFKK